MFSNSTTMTPADYAAINGNNGAFGNDSSWFLWIIVILALFNGNGFGGNTGVQDQYTLASDFATLQRQIDSVATNTQNTMNTGFDQIQRQVTATADGIASLGYDQLSRMNGINSAISSAQYDLSTQLNNIAATQASCCCTTNNNITSGFADLNYNLATQECSTRQTINDAVRSAIDTANANYRALDDKLTSMQTSALQDKIATLTSDNQALKFAASQQAQNAYLINALNPSPVPAYVVSNYSGCSGCGSYGTVA